MCILAHVRIDLLVCYFSYWAYRHSYSVIMDSVFAACHTSIHNNTSTQFHGIDQLEKGYFLSYVRRYSNLTLELTSTPPDKV